MNLLLENKTVFVTGASSGIGAAIAAAFAREGADVAISYHRNHAGAEATAQTVQTAGRQACLCPGDLRSPVQIRQVIQALPANFTTFDIAVLCAGKNKVTPLTQIDEAEWNDIFATNLSGPFFTAQALLPHMRPGGSIVTVASVAAQTGNAQHIHYAAAKAGLVNLTKSLARACAPGIRVNCVSPGVTQTPMGTATVAPDYPQKKLLIPRFATPDEIANCVVFVASPLCGFMTGATIDINGGRDLR